MSKTIEHYDMELSSGIEIKKLGEDGRYYVPSQFKTEHDEKLQFRVHNEELMFVYHRGEEFLGQVDMTEVACNPTDYAEIGEEAFAEMMRVEARNIMQQNLKSGLQVDDTEKMGSTEAVILNEEAIKLLEIANADVAK